MTDDQVALDDRYPVADAEPASAVPARLLGHSTRVAFVGDRPARRHAAARRP